MEHKINVVCDLLKACIALKNDKSLRPCGYGICGAIGFICSNGRVALLNSYKEILLHDIFKKWPEFSGDEKFPIAIKFEDPAKSYCKAHHRQLLWNESTEYGQARIRLLHFCIAELEAMIAEYEKQSKSIKPFVY